MMRICCEVVKRGELRQPVGRLARRGGESIAGNKPIGRRRIYLPPLSLADPAIIRGEKLQLQFPVASVRIRYLDYDREPAFPRVHLLISLELFV